MPNGSRDGYELSDEPARLDLDVVHGFLSRETYWAANIPRATVEKAVANSLPFGLYRDGRQVGFARVVTDRATFAYLCDVFVAADHRGRGLGKWMIERILAHPDLQGLRRFCLMTRDAHSLYEPYGFRAMPDPTRYLEIHRPDVYENA